ncbi:hypothetical protein KIW84_013038 [Lathyrus oleraceus]|uniref:Helitron helicase-like domain-containing protein n=1 Tax=Pisum sativum TaxID=3888 RepID=A0A9D5GXG7_PEA|nr:hypothetical protein KIW84_013038 [Pisum sativum]
MLQQYSCNKFVSCLSSHYMQSPIDLSHTVIEETEQVTMSDSVSIPRDGPMCLIFTPTVNSDFNSDNDDRSDYDPFATHQSEDDSSSDFDDYQPPFSINGNSPTTSEDTQNLKLRLIFDRTTNGRIYNQPTVSKVTGLVVGDIDTTEMRDIIMQTKGGQLQRINELHTSYLAYQYPLIFPYGEDGYMPNIVHRDLDIFQDNKRNRLTIREWLAFCIQNSSCETKTLLSPRRLFQQFLVDGYTMLDSERLLWIRENQLKLTVSKYKSINEEGDQSQTPGSST